MSKFHESYMSNGPAGSPDSDDLVYVRESWPNLADAMAGEYDEERRVWKVPALTLMLYIDGGRLKFCLSRKGSSRVCFGQVPNPANPLASVEAELAAGHFEWKNAGSRRG